jgi:hypothetical protein
MEENNIEYIPYQKCPKCDGQGTVSKPPYIAGDVYEWSCTSIIHQCDVCNGLKIIPMLKVQQTTEFLANGEFDNLPFPL